MFPEASETVAVIVFSVPFSPSAYTRKEAFAVVPVPIKEALRSEDRTFTPSPETVTFRSLKTTFPTFFKGKERMTCVFAIADEL